MLSALLLSTCTCCSVIGNYELGYKLNAMIIYNVDNISISVGSQLFSERCRVDCLLCTDGDYRYRTGTVPINTLFSINTDVSCYVG